MDFLRTYVKSIRYTSALRIVPAPTNSKNTSITNACVTGRVYTSSRCKRADGRTRE